LNELLSAKLRNEPFDAVLILDIDARMEPDFLRRVAAHLRLGAHAIQAAQLSKINDESEVMYISHAAQALSQMMQQARSALGLTAILAGTGMVFSRQALEQLNWQTSVGRRLSDDGELNMRCLLHDIHVIYGADLLLRNDLPASAREVRLQRRRWNQAYISLGPIYALPLLRKVARGSWRVLEAFFALALLPSCSLSFLIAGIGLILLDFWTVADPSLIPYTATLLVLWMAHGFYYISALKTLGCDLRQEDFKTLPRFMAMRALGVLEGAWLACRRDPGKRSIPSEHKDEQKEKQEVLL